MRPLCLRRSDQRPLLSGLGRTASGSVTQAGDLVILDNLGSHEGRAVRHALRSADAHLWFLPACSPDFNPVEQAFAKIKHWMRDARKRSVEDTWRHLGRLIDTIEPQECRNCIRYAGYGPTQTETFQQ